MNSNQRIPPLVELGLTDLENQIYIFLVKNSPATGYRIANKINKPTANTYKAVRSLLAKGIVVVEDSQPQAFRAVPISLLLERLEKRFQKMKARAEVELAALKPAAEDEKVYRLQTADQVYERFREMLKHGEKIVLMDLFPGAVDELKDDIEATAARGVLVVLKLYQSAKVRDCLCVVDPTGPKVVARWPGVAANAVVDGREHLIAFLSCDQSYVYDAAWSRSTLISANFHSSLFSEIMLLALLEGEQGRDVKPSGKFRRLQAIKAQGFPGNAALLKRYQDKPGNAGKKQ